MRVFSMTPHGDDIPWERTGIRARENSKAGREVVVEGARRMLGQVEQGAGQAWGRGCWSAGVPLPRLITAPPPPREKATRARREFSTE